MCGIGGVVFANIKHKPDEARLIKIADRLWFRGPDDKGFFSSSGIALVHSRLSVRDTSELGHCPMPSDDERHWIVFNGEIYNWRELRKELEISGYTFRSQTDTEVVLKGFEYWGAGVVKRLRGMFALAIWDKVNTTLLLARDRAGEKPLFYFQDDEAFSFASTPLALWRDVADLPLDVLGISCHLAHSFIPASHTAWQGVSVLPPGHTLTIQPGHPPLIKRYWELPRVSPRNVSQEKARSAVEIGLEDSVIRCLDADVPVGVFLSGGVDSSLIAAFASRHHPGLKAFSLGFAEATHSELPFARQVARHLGLEHHEILLDVDQLIDCLPHLVEQYGQPFGDASSVPSYHVARLARDHVKVCLSGDGGDELFGGYRRVQAAVYAARYGKILPESFRRDFIPRLTRYLGGIGRRWHNMNSLSLCHPGKSYGNSQSWFDCWTQMAGPLLESVSMETLTLLRVGKNTDLAEASLVQRLLFDDFQVQLPDAYLTKVDVASMAASLEVRAPFLEPNLMELAWSLPDSTKLSWGRRKVLLKQIAADLVPPDVIYRPKMGFGLPLASWFQGRLGEFFYALFDHSLAVDMGLVKAGIAQNSLVRHRQYATEETRLWLLMWLELWLRGIQRVSYPI